MTRETADRMHSVMISALEDNARKRKHVLHINGLERANLHLGLMALLEKYPEEDMSDVSELLDRLKNLE